jgi:hypothetical protein
MNQENTGDIRPGSPEERKGLAFAALIIACTALFCSFIEGWRLFSAITGIMAIIIAVYCISRARRPGARARLALWALSIGILAVLVTAYFMITAVPPEATEPGVPTETEIRPADQEGSLDRLKEVTDSAR